MLPDILVIFIVLSIIGTVSIQFCHHFYVGAISGYFQDFIEAREESCLSQRSPFEMEVDQFIENQRRLQHLHEINMELQE